MVLSDHGVIMKAQMTPDRLSPGRPRPLKAGTWSSMRELEQSCGRLVTEVPGFSYGGCQFTFLGIHAGRTPPGVMVKQHRHSYYEAILIIEGERGCTDSSACGLGSGCLQLHAPEEPHGWSSNDSLLRIGIWFTAQPPVTMRPCECWPMNPALHREARELLDETTSRVPGRRERLAARLTLLMAPLLALLDLPDRRPVAPSSGSVTASGIATFVESFLADNLTKPLALEDVAAQLNLSVPTLTRRFRRETGDAVIARLHGMRLRLAADLLRNGALSVKEVGAAVGIPEPSYFCRRFRLAFGHSPRRFAVAATVGEQGAGRRSPPR